MDENSLFSFGEVVTILLFMAFGLFVMLNNGCSCRTIYRVDYTLYGDFQPEEGWVECR